MDNMKKITKYVLLIVALYFFSKFLIYIGLNATYKDIKVTGTVPEQIKVEYAQATKVNGRILGKIAKKNDNLNGKYIKTDIYDSKNTLLGTKYLEIQDVKENEEKKFAVFFKKNSVDHCEVSSVDHKDINTEKLFDGIFLTEDMKTHIIISTLIYAIFFM